MAPNRLPIINILATTPPVNLSTIEGRTSRKHLRNNQPTKPKRPRSHYNKTIKNLGRSATIANAQSCITRPLQNKGWWKSGRLELVCKKKTRTREIRIEDARDQQEARLLYSASGRTADWNLIYRTSNSCYRFCSCFDCQRRLVEISTIKHFLTLN